MDQLGIQPPALKVVIVDDNTSLVDIYKTRLQMLGYEVHTAYDGKEALYVIEHVHPALVLLDLMVPKVAGDQILATMRTSDWGKKIKVLIISNLNEADAPPGLRDQGIEGYAVKANLANDALDRLVDDILKPEGQKEDVSLEAEETQATKPVEPAPAPAQSPAAPQAAAPATAPAAAQSAAPSAAPAAPTPHPAVPRPMPQRTRTPGTPDLADLLGIKSDGTARPAPKATGPPDSAAPSAKAQAPDKPPASDDPPSMPIPSEQPTRGV